MLLNSYTFFKNDAEAVFYIIKPNVCENWAQTDFYHLIYKYSKYFFLDVLGKKT